MSAFWRLNQYLRRLSRTCSSLDLNLGPYFVTGGDPVKCCNYQEVKIQEQVQRLAMGTIPRSIWIILHDDLVDCCKAGDDVVIWWVQICKWLIKYMKIFLCRKGLLEISQWAFIYSACSMSTIKLKLQCLQCVLHIFTLNLFHIQQICSKQH